MYSATTPILYTPLPTFAFASVTLLSRPYNFCIYMTPHSPVIHTRPNQIRPWPSFALPPFPSLSASSRATALAYETDESCLLRQRLLCA